MTAVTHQQSRKHNGTNHDRPDHQFHNPPYTRLVSNSRKVENRHLRQSDVESLEVPRLGTKPGYAGEPHRPPTDEFVHRNEGGGSGGSRQLRYTRTGWKAGRSPFNEHDYKEQGPGAGTAVNPKSDGRSGRIDDSQRGHDHPIKT